MDTAGGWRFLRDGDFAAIVTPARGLPTRTSQPDEITLWHLAKRSLLVDTEAGVICREDGVTRAETPQPDGSGRVYLGRTWGKIRYTPAHRVVWIAKHGPIPGNYRIVHRDGHRWNNGIGNLDIATHSQAMRHIRGSAYLGDQGPDDRGDAHPYVTGSIVIPKDRHKATFV